MILTFGAALVKPEADTGNEDSNQNQGFTDIKEIKEYVEKIVEDFEGETNPIISKYRNMVKDYENLIESQVEDAFENSQFLESLKENVITFEDNLAAKIKAMKEKRDDDLKEIAKGVKHAIDIAEQKYGEYSDHLTQ